MQNNLVQELIKKSFYRLTLKECQEIVSLLSVDSSQEILNIYDAYYNEKENYESLSFKIINLSLFNISIIIIKEKGNQYE